MPMKPTPAFQQWFGDSKVVYPDGTPRLVYHGTDSDFNEFRPGRGEMMFFSTEEGFAREFAEDSPFLSGGVRIVSAYLSAKNPWDYRNPEHLSVLIQRLEAQGIEIDTEYREGLEDGDWMTIEQGAGALNAIKAMGHDGIWMTESSDMTRNIAVFQAEQIKIATVNNGDIDALNTDMRFSLEAEEEPIEAEAPAS